MKKLIIFGTGKMGEMAHYYITHDSDYEIEAFTSDREYIEENQFMGLPVVPFEDIEQKYPPSECDMFVAVGYGKLNSIRREKYEAAKEKGYKLINFISSKTIQYGDTQIGDNCFILENQVFQSKVTIGNNVVIWSGNHFGHDVEIGDHAWISSHVVVSGGVKIGESSFVGVNATLRDHIKIGNKCIIGAGALILGNAEDKSVYIAQPTKAYPMDSEKFSAFTNI